MPKKNKKAQKAENARQSKSPSRVRIMSAMRSRSPGGAVSGAVSPSRSQSSERGREALLKRAAASDEAVLRIEKALARRERKDRSSQDGRSDTLGSTSAPVLSVPIRYKDFKFNQSEARGTIVSGEEFVASITTPSGGAIIGTILYQVYLSDDSTTVQSLNPSGFAWDRNEFGVLSTTNGTGPTRIGYLMKAWQRFRVRRLEFVYTPTSSFLTSGGLVLATTMDPLDVLPNQLSVSPQAEMMRENAAACQVFHTTTHVVPVDSAAKFYVSENSGASGLLQPGTQMHSVCAGVFNVTSMGAIAGSTTLGNISMRYEIELLEPDTPVPSGGIVDDQVSNIVRLTSGNGFFQITSGGSVFSVSLDPGANNSGTFIQSNNSNAVVTTGLASYTWFQSVPMTGSPPWWTTTNQTFAETGVYAVHVHFPTIHYENQLGIGGLTWALADSAGSTSASVRLISQVVGTNNALSGTASGSVASWPIGSNYNYGLGPYGTFLFTVSNVGQRFNFWYNGASLSGTNQLYMAQAAEISIMKVGELVPQLVDQRNTASHRLLAAASAPVSDSQGVLDEWYAINGHVGYPDARGYDLYSTISAIEVVGYPPYDRIPPEARVSQRYGCDYPQALLLAAASDVQTHTASQLFDEWRFWQILSEQYAVDASENDLSFPTQVVPSDGALLVPSSMGARGAPRFVAPK